MVTVYFVRHALPDHPPGVPDGDRPLSREGLTDRALALELLRDRPVDGFYCSPYRRSLETIAPAAEFFHLEIAIDPRLRERTGGREAKGDLARRWADFDFHEPDGECLRSVQDRNVAALLEILDANEGKALVLGTHGTALSAILNYFRPERGLEDFLRIVNWMPWILEARFEGHALVRLTELGHLCKEVT